MMISIVAVDSVKGSGVITCVVNTDTTGCDEDISTSIDGQRFATHVTRIGPGSFPESIAHTKSGLHAITIHAEKSNVWSGPVALDL